MENIKGNLVSFGNKIHAELHSPVHDVLSWLAVAAVSASSFLIMTTVLAQTETINAPFDPAYSTSTPVQPMPYNGGAPCVPGTPCQALENSFGMQPAQPYPQPIGSSTPFMPAPNMQQPGMQPYMGGQQPMAPQEGFMQKPPMGMENNMNFGPRDGQMNQNFGPMNNSMGEGQNFGPMNNNMGGQNFGPNEEDMKRMDAQRFEMMKKGFSRFTQEVNRVKTQVNNFKKKGLNIPTELKAALEQLDEIAKKIKEAKSADELDEVTGDMQESMQAVQEWMPILPRLAEYPRFIKQADKEIAKVNKQYKSDVAKAKRVKIDLSEQLAEFKQAIEKQEALLKEIKELAKTEPGEALDRLHEEFFGSLGDMWSNEQGIQMLLNINRGLTQMNNELRQADATIKKLKRQKIDTKELETLLKESKAKVAEVKKIAAAKPVDADALIDGVEALMEVGQEFDNKVQELTGDDEYMPDLPKNQDFKFNLPQGYEVGNNMNSNDFSSQTVVK